jgi:hypothetical protein
VFVIRPRQFGRGAFDVMCAAFLKATESQRKVASHE